MFNFTSAHVVAFGILSRRPGDPRSKFTSSAHRTHSVRMKQAAPAGHRPDPEWQPTAPDRASPPPSDEEDAKRALDAIIVAIGISTVLIINVAYVGYITTPGGPNPYWGDCFYGWFVAYFVLNGFALVFSVAALCAVTWGPYVLMWCKLSTWRTRVVNLGLAHLAISLASLLGAFVCAGFVTASVGAPELNCGNLRCSEGGVPCSPFKYGHGIGPFHNNYQPEVLWWPNGFTLDATLVKLNNATFGDLKGNNAGITWGVVPQNESVVCHSYAHIAKFSNPDNLARKACYPRCATPFDGQRDGILNDAHDMPVNKSCLMLVDTNVFYGGGRLNLMPLGAVTTRSV